MIRVPIKNQPSNIEAADDSADARLVARVERALAKSEDFTTVFDPDIASVKFDAAKSAKLLTILKEHNSDFLEEQTLQILDVARRAWFELDATTRHINDDDRNTFRAKQEEILLKDLAESAGILRAKWEELNSHPLLASALHRMLSAKPHEIPRYVEIPGEPTWWRAQFKGLDRKYFDEHYEKIVYVMKNGLIQLGDAAGLMADDISRAKAARNPEQYRFVYYLVSAWKQITGEIPTVTNNIDGNKHTGDANKKGKASIFERFATEAACGITIRRDIFKSIIKFFRIKAGSEVKLIAPPDSAP